MKTDTRGRILGRATSCCDLENALVRFYRLPKDDVYTDTSATEAPGSATPAGLTDVRIDLSGLLE